MALVEIETRESVREGECRRLGFRGVTKRFPDGTQALRPVNLRIDTGEFVSIVGPSGCGKSTLLRIAAGLSGCSSGAVDVDASQIGYVFQDATLLPWRNVQRNIGLLAELAGMPKAEVRVRVRDAIETVGLCGAETKYPRALSGGMKMRASLARALTMSPELFLFDEPFGALDEITRERLNDELLRVFAARRFAALFVTHSVAEAVYLSTRVIVMSDRPGRIVADLPVPFGYPRVPEMRYSAQFSEIAGKVSSLLRSVDV